MVISILFTPCLFTPPFSGTQQGRKRSLYCVAFQYRSMALIEPYIYNSHRASKLTCNGDTAIQPKLQVFTKTNLLDP